MLSNTIRYENKSKDIEMRDLRRGNGRLQCSPHLHRDLELVCMFRGETAVCVDTVRSTLRAGDIFLSFPNQIHSYESYTDESYIIFILKPDLMPDLIDQFNLCTPTHPIAVGALNDPRLSTLLALLTDACADTCSDSYAGPLQRGLLLAFFSELLRHYSVSQFPAGDSGALRAIVSYCTRNFSENLSLSLLEEKLHLNKYYISHIFSEKLGLRFNDYINSLRVSEACRYLLNSKMSITEISEHVGFNTLRTFNRAFIKQIGISPSEYRKHR